MSDLGHMSDAQLVKLQQWFQRHLDERSNKLVEHVAKADTSEGFALEAARLGGGVEQLRHLIFVTRNEIRAREREK